MYFILFFVRWPIEGFVKTRIAATIGASAACAIHQDLAKRCFDEARRCPNAQVIVCGTGAEAEAFADWFPSADDVWIQPQGDLGVRLSTLFARALEAGAKGVIAIGSDCPELLASDMALAISRLGECDLVVNPASDGGYVLIGMREQQSALFEAMPWSSDELLEKTLDAAKLMNLRVSIGPQFHDVDTEADWQRIEHLFK